MTITLTQSSAPLRDALYALSLAQPVPDAEVLDDIIRRYPEHADALTEFAIELAMDALRGDLVDEAAEVAVDPAKLNSAVSRAMSRFQNRLYAAKHAEPATARRPSPEAAGAANPFAALDRRAFRMLAERLNVSTLFVAKLRDRQIEPETISEGFRRRMADELSVPLEVIVTHFSAQGQSQAQPQFYKADQKPQEGSRQSFTDAVRSSGLTEDQQRYLLSL